MSQLKIKACSLILKGHFGQVVESVGESLLKVSSQNLRQIVKSTDLPASKVKKALMVLIQHNLVEFRQHSKGFVEYSINAERVLYMLRYPRYIYSAKTLYGNAGELIVEEILQNGRMSMSAVLRKVTQRLQGVQNVEAVKNKFVDLVQTHFLVRVPYPEEAGEEEVKVPNLVLPEQAMYNVPEVKLYLISEDEAPPAKRIKREGIESQPDEKMYWRVNFDRFHHFLRDQWVVQAVAKRVGPKGGEVVRTLLRLSETRSNPRNPITSPCSRHEVHQALKKEISITPQVTHSHAITLAVWFSIPHFSLCSEPGGSVIKDNKVTCRK